VFGKVLQFSLLSFFLRNHGPGFLFRRCSFSRCFYGFLNLRNNLLWGNRFPMPQDHLFGFAGNNLIIEIAHEVIIFRFYFGFPDLIFIKYLQPSVGNLALP